MWPAFGAYRREAMAHPVGESGRAGPHATATLAATAVRRFCAGAKIDLPDEQA